MNKLKLLFSTLIMGIFVFQPLISTSAQTAKILTAPVYPRTMGTAPAGTNPVYSGIKTAAKGMKVFLTADTTGGVNTFSWSITNPTGSTTTLSSTTTQNVNFVPDTTGQYFVSLTVGSTTDIDTFTVGTYKGVAGSSGLYCSTCHNTTYTSWQQTPHAKIFKEGITGQLEVAPVNGQQMGLYSVARCAKCHTTGYDQSANNGNFGYLSHQSGYDTVWAKTYTPQSGMYLIPQNDQTAWNLLSTNSTYSNAAPVSSISCESCHGPGSEHIAGLGDVKKISKTLDAGVCLQCHDAPTHHTIGTYYETSNHATMPLAGSHATSTSCFPCHSGSAYFKYTQNQTTPGYTTADGGQDITCAVCHDPHVATNFGLRLATSITLQNGYKVTSGGNGQLCMRCHQARTNGNTVVTNTAPYYGFKDRFGPHHGPQSDMFWGQNAYQFSDSTITGLMTHSSVPDACVTCHMANIGTGNSPSHQWSMVDTTGGTPKDLVGGCVSCHGPITSFDDIKASSDWDGNGKIEGVQTEVQGMVNLLASLLPKDSNDPTSVAYRMYDSLKVKGQPNIIKGIYTYYFVTEDKSMGVHNAKYTVSLLQKALSNLGWVVPVELTSFTASANYNKVSLSWQTITETNNKGFEIQKKLDNSWVTLGFVGGKGTSTNISQYSYVDNLSDAESGKLTYRLRQIDLNGKTHYSKEVEVNVVGGPSNYTLYQNYPNPFNPSTTIKFSLPFESNVKVVIYNITGAVVKVMVNSVQSAGVHQYTLNTASSGLSLSSGIYFYSIEATSLDGTHSFRETKKMVLMK
ncbi:MAG: T9SS type A sorting domain-containing protein [Bacteroidetes bacterium]|nr:T9SS type A sorting domain-containing protein [Bacteroidota bacterium]